MVCAGVYDAILLVCYFLTGGHMKIARLFLVLLFAVSWSASAQQQLGPRDGSDMPPTDLERVRVGSPAPDFTLGSKDRNPVALSGFAGKKNVLLVFYRGYW